MVDARERPVLLVGSVPLGSSSVVFQAVGTKLGKLIKRIPDGETGARKNWVVWQADVFKNTKRSRTLQHTSRRWLPSHPLQGEARPECQIWSTQNDAAAIRSYEDFKRARSEGKIPAGTRFQVSLPTPIAVVMTFTEPEAIQHIWPIYEKRLTRLLHRTDGMRKCGRRRLCSRETSRNRFWHSHRMRLRPSSA